MRSSQWIEIYYGCVYYEGMKLVFGTVLERGEISRRLKI